jgi:hypothetical protein
VTTSAVDTGADLEKAKQQLEAAQSAHDAATAAAEGPRSPDAIIAEWLELVTMRLGNRPELRALIAELKDATGEKEPETKPAE